jgi:hypothetical protein
MGIFMQALLFYSIAIKILVSAHILSLHYEHRKNFSVMFARQYA